MGGTDQGSRRKRVNCKGVVRRKRCKEKTYYNRVRRVREEAISAIEPHSSGQIANLADIASGRKQIKPEAPVFAAIPVPQSKGSAITVWIKGHTVDIQNGAEYSLVEETLRVVSRL